MALLGLAYFLFFGKTKNVQTVTPNNTLETSAGSSPVSSIVNPNPLTGAEANKISQEFVNQLINLKAIKLNDDIFSSLAFQSLQDFSITLVQPGNEGRPNPFAPFGADNTDTGLGSGGDVIFTPGPEAWSAVKLGNTDIFYPSSWTPTTINYSAQGVTPPPIVGYTFKLPNGLSVVYGGPQSSCTTGSFGAFQYGVSTKTCLKNVTVEVLGGTISSEDKNAFGEFIQRNM